MSDGAEATVNDLCLKLGIGAGQIKVLRRQFRMEHGDQAEDELAGYLGGLWRDLEDKPRYPMAGGGNSHVGNPNHRWSKNEEQGYTTSPSRAVERGVEAVSAEVQEELTNRSHHAYDLVRRDELDRRELSQLASRAKDLAKRSPVGTNFGPTISAVRSALEVLDRAAARAA